MKTETIKPPMRLVRNTTEDGRCKYALVRLDKLRALPEDSLMAQRIATALDDLAGYGVLEYGEKGSADEFFVLKLKDRLSIAAIEAYTEEAENLMNAQTNRADYDYWRPYVEDLCDLQKRAAKRSGRKLPD